MKLNQSLAAVVTGGASGLGEATARRLAAQGVKVALFDMNEAKGEALAQELGGQPLVDLIRDGTHTCYLGERGALHDWGYGCGTCPACELRARGYQQYAAGLTGETSCA